MKKSYFLKRLLFIPLTLFGIMVLNFLFIQLAPGGPVEQVLMRLESGQPMSATARISGESSEIPQTTSGYRGAQGMREDLKQELIKRFHFDQPAVVRFFKMMWDFIRFDFGKSFYQDKTVLQLIAEKMPVSMSLGIFSTLLIYCLSIPLGIQKAVRQNTRFDIVSSWILTIFYAIPAFLLSIFFIIFFAAGRYFNWFPLTGLVSSDWADFSFFHKIGDYLWHLVLPVLSLSLGGMATLTFLTRNSFLDEIHKNYCLTAKAKGASEKRILYKHVFRNAMLIVMAGFPVMLIGMLFTGSVLIEVIFSLDGLGLLGYEAIQTRDYPVVFGTLYLFALLGLVLNLLSDFIYTRIDPRINFDERLS